jgi:outer membrane protein assembly factor BamB
MSADGNLIVLGTVSGWVLAFNNNGDLLWQRHLPGNLQGHNALDVSPNGQFIAVGSAGDVEHAGYVTLFNRSGAVLWQTQFRDRRDQGTFKYPYTYDHNHRGAITVAVSDDGGYIVAGYGDSTLRIFGGKTVH